MITIKCPLCDKGIIRLYYRKPYVTYNLSTTTASKRTKAGTTSAEIEDPLDDCSICGATKETIKKRLKEGEMAKPLSREEILRRMKEAGLPTKIIKKLKD